MYKPKLFFAVLIAMFGFFIIIYIQFTNIDMTTARRIVEFWPSYIMAILCFISAYGIMIWSEHDG